MSCGCGCIYYNFNVFYLSEVCLGFVFYFYCFERKVICIIVFGYIVYHYPLLLFKFCQTKYVFVNRKLQHLQGNILVNISKCNAINSSCFINAKFLPDGFLICSRLHKYDKTYRTFRHDLSFSPLYKYAVYIKIKTCKHLLFNLTIYLHWWFSLIFVNIIYFPVVELRNFEGTHISL